MLRGGTHHYKTRQWATVKGRQLARFAEIRKRPPKFVLSEGEILEAWEAIVVGLIVADQTRFGHIVDNLETASANNACWLGRSIYRTALALPVGVYAIVSESDLREGVQKLAALHANHQGEPNRVLPLPRSSTEVAQFRHSDPKVWLRGGN